MSFQTIPVGPTAQVPLVNAGDGVMLISNGDANNTIYLSDDYGAQPGSVNTTPLAPGAFLTVDGKTTVYGVTAAGKGANAYVIPGGLNFFQLVKIVTKIIEITASAGNGLYVYSGTPSANNLLHSITSTAQLDPTGFNLTKQGDVSYGTGGLGFFAIQIANSAIEWWTAVTEAGSWIGLNGINVLKMLSAGGAALYAIVVSMNSTPGIANSNASAFAIGVGEKCYLAPSLDTGGVTDFNSITIALLNFPDIELLPGDFYINQTVKMSLGQHIYAGPQVNIHNLAAGAFAFSIQNSGTYVSDQSASLTGGFTIKCGGSTPQGVEFGDIAGLKLDCWVEHTTGIAAHALNGNHFSEWNIVNISLTDCARGLVFERTGTGTNSYDRSRYRLFGAQPANDSWVEIGGAAGDIALIQGALEIYGNAHDSSKIIEFKTAGSIISDCLLQIGVENDATTTPPQTIKFNGLGKIDRCFGALAFSPASGGNWTPSDNNGTEFTDFTGDVFGDITLGTGVVDLATALPAGWTGHIYARTKGDDVEIDFELNIAATTVVNQGSTIQTIAAIPWTPPANKYIIVNHFVSAGPTNTPVSINIDTAGNIKFVSAGFTAGAGGDALNGQGRYSKRF